ncbi:tRNA:m(4)X modification enzyme TRM13 like [Pseudolycoriella hygida]|uniref:tRNA:m(4)X modification enzyme TRM13 n=1 Tax=Pseudolycoriella hygida TaxID=35572 RepID=A0A9Q0MV85_9DIPT|nr:tRNA:m(4)X modification enzyme TRM13 like [Pseudolycoriella hygida]
MSEVKKNEFKSEKVVETTCKHFVQRRKRFCRMTVARGQEYCGEHMNTIPELSHISEENFKKRVPCPLDPKHTVYLWNLKKHLNICNARVKEMPSYIQTGRNLGEDDTNGSSSRCIKLSEIDEHLMNEIIDKINKIYEEHVDGTIEEMICSHPVLNDELSKESYGSKTLKHLTQTSSILGCLKQLDLLLPKTCFIEFGAGKGQVSFWLAEAMKDTEQSTVLLVDKASLRHKKDNKIEDRNSVQRIRADISDLDLEKLEAVQLAENIVAVGKHLCGGATDVTLRCLINGNQIRKSVKGFVIALCCHHRCTWRAFVGKKFLVDNGITQQEFDVLTKMVGWAVCGTGMSRQLRKEIEMRNEQKETTTNVETTVTAKIPREEREKIGMKCKRILDYARIQFLHENGFTTSLKYYVTSDVTLENVCLIGITSNNKI